METTGYANRKMPNTGGWQDRHDRAWRSSLAPGLKPHSEASAREFVERSMVVMLKGWAAYAHGHAAQHGSKLGEDYVLGPAWVEAGKALRTLLNGELGRLDGGTLDAFILDTVEEAGFPDDTMA